MRYLLCLVAIVLIIGCGKDEKTPCDKLVDIWQEICALPEDVQYPCFPCSCALCGRRWEIPLRMGMPDIDNSSCEEMGPCEGVALTFAETCLEHAPPAPYKQPFPEGWTENDCDPRYAYDIWLCDNGQRYNPALPEVIAKGFETYDCVE